MKKIGNFILKSLYIFILMILSLILFWELYAKNYVQKYIDFEYGHDIKETKSNSNLIIEMLNDEPEG